MRKICFLFGSVFPFLVPTVQLFFALPDFGDSSAGLFIAGSPVKKSRDTGATIQAASSATDYFRTVADGNWTAVATWESSPDNANWTAATLTPTSAANLVTIRNGHDVSITTGVTIDQLTIEGGGVLTHSSGTLTVNDGASGDDITVQSGGIFVLVSSGITNPSYTGTATTNIQPGGILRVSKSSYTGNGSGVNSVSYIYSTGSIVEYTLATPFSASGVTYFPNVGSNTIPVFRITDNIGLAVGGGSNTVINGVFEANGNVSFTGLGTKTFRNGILGTGNITGSASGKFIINGTQAVLGGAGSLTVPTTNGLEIGVTTVLGLVSDKTVTGSMSLLAGGMIELGNFDLTVTGNLTGGASNGYVKTNGTGSLHLQNIGTGPVSFPIGNSTYNPISIANGSSANWCARVEDAVNNVQAALNIDKAINRTWHIVPTGVLGVAPGVTFNFDDNDDNQLVNPAAYSADPVRNVQFFHYETGNWSAVSGSVPLAPAEGPQSIVLSNYYFYGPVAISKTSGPLPVKFTNVRAYSVNAGIRVEWTNLTESDVVHYSVERSANGRDFTSLGTAAPARNDGGEATYGWLDSSPLPGVNFYRILSLEVDGKRLNSSIVRVDLRGVKDIKVYPNPLRGRELTVQAELSRGSYPIRVLNAAGQQVFSHCLVHSGGMITEVLELPVLKSGTYYLVLGETVRVFVVQRLTYSE